MIVEEELKRAGVTIKYVLADYEDTPEGRLSKHIRATIAEYEREKIRERMVRGKRNKVKSGNVILHGYRPPYGYRPVSENNRTTLAINPEEARIIRLIFKWYTVGDDNGPLGLRQIARKLTRMGVLTSGDKGRGIHTKRREGWAKQTIYYMLKNETYIGKWHYGKTRRRNGKRIPTSKADLIPVEVPAIIDLETWNKGAGNAGRKP